MWGVIRAAKGASNRCCAKGVCRLHGGSERPLRNSHIIPSWAFERLGGGASQIVLMSNGTAILSNDQMRERLLCEPCEQVIGVSERYVSQIVRQQDGSFPALTMVQRVLSPPGTATEHAADASSLDTDAIARFAASIFWRASVSTRFTELTLGRYEEHFRNFLRRQAAFPVDARLIATLIRPIDSSPVDQVMTMPAGSRADGYYHQYIFVVLGIELLLAVGGQIPPAFDDLCLVRTRLVLVSSRGAFTKRMITLGAAATAKGKLARRPR